MSYIDLRTTNNVTLFHSGSRKTDLCERCTLVPLMLQHKWLGLVRLLKNHFPSADDKTYLRRRAIVREVY
jgi:hypothetical protein